MNYFEKSIQVFANILITPNLTHQHENEDCDYNPEFFVKIDDNSGCW